MKKINIFLILSVICYLIFAWLIAFSLSQMNTKENHAYRIEINRFMEQFDHPEQLDKITYQTFTYIEHIAYLDAQTQDQASIQKFYQEDNQLQIHIQPYFKNQMLQGYIKFFYKNTISFTQVFYLLEALLLLMEVSLFLFLWYLKKEILIPFEQIQNLPLQFAQGHYKSDVILQKSNYLNTLLWGLGQLKDSLDLSKKRRLELEKEKKQLLLSLSHDMKTPLNLIKLYGKALEENIYSDVELRTKAIHQIGEKANEMEAYVDRIITSSREDILDLQVIQSEFYLSSFMHNVLQVYQPQCERRSIQLYVQPFNDRLLKGDLERSQEVFENLFENIFKYGDGRCIDISFYEEEYCQLIRIYNSGKPVSDNEFNHLFDSFFRGANSSGKAGSGLGLYICRELMQKMDGAIFAQKSDDGMAFVLVFR